MKKREFSRTAMYHIYHRCEDKGVLFYSIEDRIVYYTLAAVYAKKYGIKVSAASLMFTHLHQSLEAETGQNLERYLRTTDSSFVRLYNYRYERSGHLFEHPPGRSLKRTGKDKRSNIIYVFNNHVEKGLCRQAANERWSFLAYAYSDHPFSLEYDKKKASKTLSKAMKLVDRRILKNKSLEYTDLDRILPHLSGTETEQFIDYVISNYAWVDFSRASSHFSSQEAMITAINSTTGSEFDINEDYVKEKDSGYAALVDYARRNGIIGRIFTMSGEEKMDHIIRARFEPGVRDSQLMRFFHFKYVLH